MGGDQPEATQNKSSESRCIRCNKDFIYRIDLKKHIIDAHKTYKPCRNLKTCSYLPKCKYNHQEYPPGTQICYECGKTLKTTNDLMRHRKKTHKVELCKSFLKGNCGFSAEDCYYTHGKQALAEPVLIVENKPTNTVPQAQGFWEAPSNLAPPSGGLQLMQHGPTQSEWIQLKQTLSQINLMMKKFL